MNAGPFLWAGNILCSTIALPGSSNEQFPNPYYLNVKSTVEKFES
jgi:hypothetical protein